MDDMDDVKIKAELDDIGETIDDIIKRVRALESEIHLESTGDDS